MRSKKPANYNTAKADCVSKQGTLLVINDREEMDFLAGKLLLLLVLSYHSKSRMFIMYFLKKEIILGKWSQLFVNEITLKPNMIMLFYKP